MDYYGRIWVFQGAKFSIFEDFEAGIPLAGYPKSISSISNLDAAFLNGLDAVASFYDDFALFFKGDDLVIVDLREVAQVGDTVYSIGASFELQEANGCDGGIDAIVSTYWTLDFICGDLVSEFRWGSGTAAPQLLTEKWRGIYWGAGLNTHVGAALREPFTGRIRLWKGNQVADIYPCGCVVVSQANGLGSVAVNTCNVENCRTCSTDGNTCDVCLSGYSRRRWGLVCRSSNYIVDLSFEDTGYTSTF